MKMDHRRYRPNRYHDLIGLNTYLFRERFFLRSTSFPANTLNRNELWHAPGWFGFGCPHQGGTKQLFGVEPSSRSQEDDGRGSPTTPQKPLRSATLARQSSGIDSRRITPLRRRLPEASRASRGRGDFARDASSQFVFGSTRGQPQAGDGSTSLHIRFPTAGPIQGNGVGDFDALDRADESGSLSHSYVVHRSRSPGNAPVRRPAPAIGPEFPGWAACRVFAVRGQSWNLHQRIIMSSWVSPRSVSMDHTLQRIRIFGFDWSLLPLSRGFGISRLHEFKKRLTSKA